MKGVALGIPTLHQSIGIGLIHNHNMYSCITKKPNFLQPNLFNLIQFLVHIPQHSPKLVPVFTLYLFKKTFMLDPFIIVSKSLFC